MAAMTAFAVVGLALANAVRVGGSDFEAAAYLLLGLALVGTFDVWLPRGDYSEMGGALVLAAGLVLQPLLAAAVVVAARLFVWATRKFSENPMRVLEDVSRRVMLMGWSLCLYRLVGGPSSIEATIAGRGSANFEHLLLVAIFYVAMDLSITQLSASLRLGTPYVPLLLGNLRLQGWMGTAQVSAAVLAVLTYNNMRLLGIGIVAGLLLVMRQSFSLLVEVRQAYRSTIEALARAIEAQDPARRGHAERVAQLSTEAGRVLGMHGKALESLTYAALFHDVGRLDVDDTSTAKGGSHVLEAVGFLATSVPILKIIDLRGQIDSSPVEEHLVASYIVMRMSDYDVAGRGLPPNGDAGVADSIGARLYENTRLSVDRALARVQRRFERGRLPTTRAALEEAW